MQPLLTKTPPPLANYNLDQADSDSDGVGDACSCSQTACFTDGEGIYLDTVPPPPPGLAGNLQTYTPPGLAWLDDFLLTFQTL